MVDRVAYVFGQVAGFVENHVPGAMGSHEDAVAFGLLAAGILLSVLGAKLARPALTLGFAALGVGLAVVFGRGLDFPLAASVVLGAFVVGVFGFALFRLWVGIGVAVLLSSIAVGVYGSSRILPHLASFEEGQVAPVEFVIPDVSLEDRDPWETLRDSCREFWAHVKAKDTRVERNVLLVVAVAGLIGLALGTLAVRFSLVVFTAFIGTSAVVSALSLILRAHYPAEFDTVLGSPRAVTGAVLGFFGASLVLQALLTRRPPEAKPPAAE